MREKLIGDRRFYRRLFAIAVPMMIQMAITNFASMLDNVMVGQMGTEQMTGVAIANQLVFVYNLFIFLGRETKRESATQCGLNCFCAEHLP